VSKEGSPRVQVCLQGAPRLCVRHKHRQLVPFYTSSCIVHQHWVACLLVGVFTSQWRCVRLKSLFMHHIRCASSLACR
jgi:hypothetical protein